MGFVSTAPTEKQTSLRTIFSSTAILFLPAGQSSFFPRPKQNDRRLLENMGLMFDPNELYISLRAKSSPRRVLVAMKSGYDSNESSASLAVAVNVLIFGRERYCTTRITSYRGGRQMGSANPGFCGTFSKRRL